MAQLTPNYGLSMPEPTDPFGYNSFLPLFNENMEIIDENMGGGGGSGSLDAVETNSDAYAQLPQTDKDDPTKIYFLNDTQSSEVETPVDFTQFYNWTQSSTTISVVDGELVYTWNGGSNIQQTSYYTPVIPANVKKIKYKLTTGSSSYYNNVSADARWQICIGVRADYTPTTDLYPTSSDWLAIDIYNTVDSVFEGELDLSNISSDCYLVLIAKGWNLVWNEISTVEDSEITDNTEIRYKDVAYGNGSGGSGNLTAQELTQAEYDALTQAEKESETDVYFINDTVKEEVETPVDITQWQNTAERNMSISTQSGFLVYGWGSGSYIGAFSIYQVQIPADVKKIKYKLTTGTSYSNTTPRFRIGVGVKAINSTTPTPLPDTAYDNTWIKFVAHDERNTTIEGELDLSDVTDACYLYFTAPGWNVKIDEMVLVTEQETSETVRKIMYQDVTYGGSSANIVSLTQVEYDALPSSKESDNVLYLAYFDGGQTLDPNYSYHKYGDNDEIIVRVYHEGQLDQQILWFFRGWNQTSGDVAIPTELASYKPANPSSAIHSANYPNGGTAQDGWIGFYNNNIRAWIQSLTQTTTGVMYGVVDIAGGERQSLPYVDDPYVYIQDADATRRIYYNGREYAEFNGGSGGGANIPDAPTTDGTYTLQAVVSGGVPTYSWV